VHYLIWLQRTAGNRAVAAHLDVQRSAGSDLIDEHTSWGNLAEDDLGRTLLARAVRGDHQLVQATLGELASRNRDDVSLEFVVAATNDQLVAIAASDTGRRLLDRMYDELTEGNLGDDEQRQADRILRVKSQRADPAQAQQQMLSGKVFPFRQGGITVLHDAPIIAERRDRGQIWVKQPARVFGTSLFRDETSTLPTAVFVGGALLPEDEIVGVKFYDLGGEVVYRPALFLVQVSNQNNTATLTKMAEIAGIGLTLGTGTLAGLGIKAGLTTRVLLWADRTAFVLGMMTTIINEHRGEIIERFADSGRQFLRYVDIVHSATAMYGFARLAISMGQIIIGLRTSYGKWCAAVDSLEDALDDGERRVIQQISQHTEEVLENADNVGGLAIRSQSRAAPENVPLTQVPAPNRLDPYAEVSTKRLRTLAKRDKAAAEALVTRYEGWTRKQLQSAKARGDQTAKGVLESRIPENTELPALRGKKGEKRPVPHEATARVTDGQGNVTWPGPKAPFRSGEMTPEQKKLGYPKAGQATHTEIKAINEAPLEVGYTLRITGQYNPCDPCQKAMIRASEGGRTVEYWWQGGTFRAFNGKEVKPNKP
jgi:hypothetical protein